MRQSKSGLIAVRIGGTLLALFFATPSFAPPPNPCPSEFEKLPSHNTVSVEQALAGHLGGATPQLGRFIKSGLLNYVYHLIGYPHVKGLPAVRLVARGLKDHLQKNDKMRDLIAAKMLLAREAGFTQYGFPIRLDGKTYFVVEYRGDKNFKERKATVEEMRVLKRLLHQATLQRITYGDAHLENFVGGYPIDFDGMRRENSVEEASDRNQELFNGLCRIMGYKPEDIKD